MREYKTENKQTIFTTTFSTPLGEMFTATTKKGIVILTFFTPFYIEAKIAILKEQFNADVIPGNCEIFELLRKQLNEYFTKKRKNFEIPLQMVGSPFQIKVWQELLKIPYGQTISYKEQALRIGNEKAYRAVANANGQNMIDIIIPCHRVISSNKSIGGYNGGVEIKEYLLKLEQDDK